MYQKRAPSLISAITSVVMASSFLRIQYQSSLCSLNPKCGCLKIVAVITDNFSLVNGLANTEPIYFIITSYIMIFDGGFQSLN